MLGSTACGYEIFATARKFNALERSSLTFTPRNRTASPARS